MCVNPRVKNEKKLPCAKTRKICVNAQTNKMSAKLCVRNEIRFPHRLGEYFTQLCRGRTVPDQMDHLTKSHRKNGTRKCGKFVFVFTNVLVFVFVFAEYFTLCCGRTAPDQMDHLTKSDR